MKVLSTSTKRVRSHWKVVLGTDANMHGVSFGPHNSINPHFQVVKCVFKKAHRESTRTETRNRNKNFNKF